MSQFAAIYLTDDRFSINTPRLWGWPLLPTGTEADSIGNPLHTDLSLERFAMKAQRNVRICPKLLPFPAIRIGEKAEYTFIDTFTKTMLTLGTPRLLEAVRAVALGSLSSSSPAR